jgi:signal peptidase
MTKGDNNNANDISLYPRGRHYASRDEVVGVVVGYMPWVGWLVIGISQACWLRYLVLGFVALSVSKELMG